MLIECFEEYCHQICSCLNQGTHEAWSPLTLQVRAPDSKLLPGWISSALEKVISGGQSTVVQQSWCSYQVVERIVKTWLTEAFPYWFITPCFLRSHCKSTLYNVSPDTVSSLLTVLTTTHSFVCYSFVPLANAYFPAFPIEASFFPLISLSKLEAISYIRRLLFSFRLECPCLPYSLSSRLKGREHRRIFLWALRC